MDGNHHFTFEGIERDKYRDKHLSEMKITVLRFENKMVLENLTLVLKEIKANFCVK